MPLPPLTSCLLSKQSASIRTLRMSHAIVALGGAPQGQSSAAQLPQVIAQFAPHPRTPSAPNQSARVASRAKETLRRNIVRPPRMRSAGNPHWGVLLLQRTVGGFQILVFGSSDGIRAWQRLLPILKGCRFRGAPQKSCRSEAVEKQFADSTDGRSHPKYFSNFWRFGRPFKN